MVSLEMILTGLISGVLGSGIGFVPGDSYDLSFGPTVLPSVGWSILSAGLVIGAIALLGRIVRPG